LTTLSRKSNDCGANAVYPCMCHCTRLKYTGIYVVDRCEPMTEIQTGVERSNTRLTNSDFEVEAYADDGEHATAWMVRRLDDTTVEAKIVRCEAGLRDSDGTEVFDIPEDKGTVQFAQEMADADPEMAVELARDYWN